MSLKPDNAVRAEVDEEKVYGSSLKDDREVLAPVEVSGPGDD